MGPLGITQKLHLPEIQENVFEMAKSSRGSKKALFNARLSRNLCAKGFRGKLHPFIKVELHHTGNGLICRSSLQSELIYPGNPRRHNGFMRKLGRGPFPRKRIRTQAAVKFGNGLLKVNGQESDRLCVDAKVSSQLQMKQVNVGRGICEIPVGSNFDTPGEGASLGKTVSHLVASVSASNSSTNFANPG